MNSKISVFGLGYVGSVTAACLASKGNTVIGVDLNASKVEQILAGRAPIVEPDVQMLIEEGRRTARLCATTDTAEAALATDISMLCVGTPSLRSGKLDLGHIEPVCRGIAEVLLRKNSFHLIVLRSTALPGTAETLVIPTIEKVSRKRFGPDFGVCVNPEFMREGTAVHDFLRPSITVVGASYPEHAARVRSLYDWAPGRFFETSFRSAEMLKYASNAWHATKVAFANEVGTMAKEFGADAETLFEMFCADAKLNISPSYLKPGFAFGGSCLPKDVRALNHRAKELDLSLPLLDSIMPSNEQHLRRALEIVMQSGKKHIALLGLSFKSNTDDLRESPQVQLVKQLIGEGYAVTIWDESVSLGRLMGSNREYIEHVIPHIGSLLCNDLTDALRAAEVIVLANRAVTPDMLMRHLRHGQTVIDLVNLEKSRQLASDNDYHGICW